MVRVVDEQITEHFYRYEFASRWDGVPYPADWIPVKLLPLCRDRLEPIRAAAGGHFVHLTSGYRTEANNDRLPKAVKNSYHCQGIACDFFIDGVQLPDLCALILRLILAGKIPDGGVGRYPTLGHSHGGWVHVDSGPGGRRWEG